MDLAAAKAAAAAVAARGKEPAAGGASAGAVAAARAAAAALAARKAAAAPPAAAAPTAAPLLPDAAKQAAAAFAAKHSQPAVPSAGVEAARAAAAAFAKSLPTEKQAAHLAGQAALNPGGGKAQAPGAFVVQPPGGVTPNVDAMAAARLAAQKLAASMGGGGGGGSGAAGSSSSSSSAGAPPAASAAAAAPNPEDAKRAAAAFAANLSKKPRWGDGPTAMVAQDGSTGGPSASKLKQALAVSKLSGALQAFRKDRGTVEAGAKKTLKLFIPEYWAEQAKASGREPRNWVGLLIGRDGINRKRLQQSTGATLYLRGRGTELRGQTKLSEQVDKRGRLTEAGEAMEEMHVLLEADTDEQIEAARVQVMMIIDPPDKSSALTLFQEGQLETCAEQKTLKTEECAFCGKPGHHHSKCPKRKSTFVMSGVVCAACGNSGHTARDCKGDKSNIVKKHTPGGGLGVGNPSVFEDEDFAAFSAELAWRS